VRTVGDDIDLYAIRYPGFIPEANLLCVLLNKGQTEPETMLKLKRYIVGKVLSPSINPGIC
jgi:hypothetical protein